MRLKCNLPLLSPLSLLSLFLPSLPHPLSPPPLFYLSLLLDLPDILVPPTDVMVPESNTASFTCLVDSNPLSAIQWLYNGVSIPGAMV